MGKTFNTGRLGNGLFVDANGNVGIGTTSPTGLLELSKANSGGLGPILFLRNNTATANNNAVQISMAANSGGDATSPTCKIVLTETSTAAASLSFYLYDGVSTLHERFKIGSDGIVTIKNGKQLVIDSGITGEAGLFIKAEGTNTGSGFTNIQSFYGSVGYISPLVLNRYGGNVGIGTTTPEGLLHIKGANSGGYTGMTVVNYDNAVNTAVGIDFGCDASTSFNGAGNAQIKVTNNNASNAKSQMDIKVWTGAALVTGINISDTGKVSFPAATAMNYAVSNATAVTVTNNCSPTTVASVTLTTSGKPVLITVSGDNNPLGGSTWCYVMIFRNGSAVGKRIICESTGSSVNVPFSLTHIDTPSAGSNTYTAMVSVCGSNPIIFGETGDVQAPTITVVELL